MNLYDQLQALQVIPDAWNKWAAYRGALTSYLIENTYGSREIAILGAGGCNDLDLKMLIKYFDRLYLIDRNRQTMESALKQYGLTKHPQVVMKVLDFTGLDDEDYRRYADEMVALIRQRGKNIELEELTAAASKALDHIQEKIKKAQPRLEMYDNVVAIGVHSQLITMLEWIWTVLLQLVEKEETGIRKRIIGLNDQCVKAFNDLIVSSVRHRAVTGCEEKRLGMEGGIQGAAQAINDFAQREKRKEIIVDDVSRIIWPFNEEEGKLYQVKLMTFSKNI